MTYNWPLIVRQASFRLNFAMCSLDCQERCHVHLLKPDGNQAEQPTHVIQQANDCEKGPDNHSTYPFQISMLDIRNTHSKKLISYKENDVIRIRVSDCPGHFGTGATQNRNYRSATELRRHCFFKLKKKNLLGLGQPSGIHPASIPKYVARLHKKVPLAELPPP